MIAKDLAVPQLVLLLEALIPRLAPSHPKLQTIESDLRTKRSGYYGERSLQFYLQYLPDKETFIFYNLYLNLAGVTFEIDLLVLSTKFALVFETKNMLGKMHFDADHGQLIRTFNGKDDSFTEPVEQAKRHIILLQEWMNEHVGFQLPMDYLVIVSSTSTIISSTPGKAHLFKNVIHANKLINRLHELEKRYRVDMCDAGQLRKLRTKLLKGHCEPVIDVMSKYHLTKDDILPGVACPKCHRLGMNRHRRRWECLHCGCVDNKAHLAALCDYFYLVDRSISNQECRKFLGISSPDVANRLLKSLGLVEQGDQKGRRYVAPVYPTEIYRLLFGQEPQMVVSQSRRSGGT